MKKLKDILEDVQLIESIGKVSIEISSIEFDSRKVSNSSLFVATRGTQIDSHTFIEKAITSGATAILCEELPTELNESVCYLKVENSQKALGIIASNWFNQPSKSLKLVGVTGTNGKTTIATLLHQLFLDLGYEAGLISTIENKIGKHILPSTHTTPDAVAINNLMAQMLDAKCEFCFMEVSSHALHQYRTEGLDFDGAIFTNLSHDHLDYHNDFASYIKAKKMFFDGLKKDAFAITNQDDKNGMVMLQNCKADQYTYSVKSIGDFTAKIIENQFSGLNLNIDGQDVWFRLIGSFNAYNLLAIYSTAILLKQDKQDVLSKLSNLSSANGRFEVIQDKKGVSAIVDYAHTPDALLNVLQTMHDILSDGSRILCVIGAGGNRDKAKRPKMAKIAIDYSHQLILTSDNPRFEKPEDILNDMKTGLSATESLKAISITNREEAIKTAYHLSNPGDVILVAGKGHETYQEIEGVKHHFDDKEVITKIFNQN